MAFGWRTCTRLSAPSLVCTRMPASFSAGGRRRGRQLARSYRHRSMPRESPVRILRGQAAIACPGQYERDSWQLALLSPLRLSSVPPVVQNATLCTSGRRGPNFAAYNVVEPHSWPRRQGVASSCHLYVHHSGSVGERGLNATVSWAPVEQEYGILPSTRILGSAP